MCIRAREEGGEGKTGGRSHLKKPKKGKKPSYPHVEIEYEDEEEAAGLETVGGS
jgi:hypothetical protein